MVEAGEAMSDDIVTRLRAKGNAWCSWCFDDTALMVIEAADEIEGLREALAMANKFAEGWHKRALKAEGHA